MQKTVQRLPALARVWDDQPTGEEEDLIERARQDPAAFAALYDRYLPHVYRYLYTRVSTPADAEDLTSQVFLTALEAMRTFRPGSFRAWLFGIARRKAADYYRRRAPQVSLEQAAGLAFEQSSLLAQVIHNEALHRLCSSVNRLAEDERELLRLRFAARLSFAEIAQVLGKKESAVKMALYRLLDRLEAQMEANHD